MTSVAMCRTAIDLNLIPKVLISVALLPTQIVVNPLVLTKFVLWTFCTQFPSVRHGKISYFQPQLTNLDDFLAKIVIFIVLICPMMTRSL